jgi:poly(3-hydroxybutyrate) depolymerase
MINHMSSLFRKLALAILCCAPVFAGETVIKDKQDMDCFVYTPDPIDPAKTYQLMVGVHGARGNGKNAAGLKNWAERGDVIVIGPSFDTNGGFQGGDGVHAEKLIALFETLKKTYKLRDQMFLYGFSAGSQFTHRFAMLNPKWVCGVSAHSGGSWATDGYGEISTTAKKIPFAISCGENDTQFSVAGYPYNRLDWYKRFKEEIDKKGFCYIGGTWPGVGHSASAGVWDLTKQCFQLATGLPGASATEQVVLSDQWKNLENLPKPPRSTTSSPKPAVPDTATQAEIDKMAPAAFKRADTEKIPDDALIVFMKKYPPALWKDKPGSAKLLEQCKAAAISWQAAAKDKNMWNDSLKLQFAQFTAGLDIKAE